MIDYARQSTLAYRLAGLKKTCMKDKESSEEKEGCHFSFCVGPESTGVRLDRFLAEQPEILEVHLSRTRLKSLIETACVTLSGQPLKTPAHRLSADTIVTLYLPPPEPAKPQGENIALDIVYEDEALIVINKSAGLVVHPASGHESGTLVNALIAHCGDSLSGVGGVKKPGIVHRIDKDTTGLLVIAKTDAAHHGLAQLFADHGRNLPLTREYLAFVWGAPDRVQGTIETAIGRHAIQREKMAVVSHERGREAITHWEKRADYGIASLIACQLETGRTHQIRVHMAHIGHPLIGDATYGAGFKTKISKLPEEARAAVLHLGRQALHAATLGFLHPVTGEEMIFESELPQDLVALKKALETMRSSA
jgi:23S rRNA pseudouridine1911/1915/1917 synthase